MVFNLCEDKLRDDIPPQNKHQDLSSQVLLQSRRVIVSAALPNGLRKPIFPQPALMFAFKGPDTLIVSAAAEDVGSEVRTAGDRTRRRRLNKLSCADWSPHDRGFVSGLPRSQWRASVRGPAHNWKEDSPPWSCRRHPVQPITTRAPRLREGRLVHIQSHVSDSIHQARLPCMRLCAGQSGITLNILHVERRAARSLSEHRI
jgi:hypothetical protein